MRCNKINNIDLFISTANKLNKHIKPQCKQALQLIKLKIDWEKIPKSIKYPI